MSVWEFFLDLRLKVDVCKYSLYVSVEHQDRRQCGGHPAECGNGPHWDTEVLPIRLLQSLAHDQDIPRSHHLLHHLCGLPRLRRNNLECKDGWKRSQRFWRREEQAMDLWANVQKHEWTMPQGTLAPGEGLGGGVRCLVVGWFCQSNLDVNSVTVDFHSLTLEGDEDDGDADEGGTEIYCVFKKRGGCSDSLCSFKLHLHLHSYLSFYPSGLILQTGLVGFSQCYP